MDALSHIVTPGVAQKVEAANERLFGQLIDPVGIATIALSAGICEEALFRARCSPAGHPLDRAGVRGVLPVRLSLDAAAVLVLAIGLGVLRRITNTTTTTPGHVV